MRALLLCVACTAGLTASLPAFAQTVSYRTIRDEAPDNRLRYTATPATLYLGRGGSLGVTAHAHYGLTQKLWFSSDAYVPYKVFGENGVAQNHGRGCGLLPEQ